MTAPTITTFLWFDGQAQEAATLYTSLFDDARIVNITPSQGDPVVGAFLVEFELQNQRFAAMNGGPRYTLTPAVSVSVLVDEQSDVDRLWTALLADGGSEMRCGWLTDRFGLSWQIVPRALMRLMAEDKSGRVMQAMMGMVKLDIAGLEAAAIG